MFKSKLELYMAQMKIIVSDIHKRLVTLEKGLKTIQSAFKKHEEYMNNGLQDLAYSRTEMIQELDRLADWKNDQTKNFIKLQRRVTQLEKQK